MNLTLTNTASEPEAIITPDGSFAAVLEPQTPYDLNSEDASVLIVGDKPSVREQLQEGLAVIEETVKAIITKIAERKDAHQQRIGEAEPVRVTIANHGSKDVRVILGTGAVDVTIAAGTSQPCGAPGYVEIRELGDLDESQVDGGRQPSTAA